MSGAPSPGLLRMRLRQVPPVTADRVAWRPEEVRSREGRMKRSGITGMRARLLVHVMQWERAFLIPAGNEPMFRMLESVDSWRMSASVNLSPLEREGG